jgi:hypothetical protein
MKHSDLPADVWFLIRVSLTMAIFQWIGWLADAVNDRDIIRSILYLMALLLSTWAVFRFMAWELGHRKPDEPEPKV